MAIAYEKRTLAAQSSNYKEWLRDMYLYFEADSLNWQLKAGVTLPASVSAVGDAGFVIEDKATQSINIAFGSSSAVGSVLINGGAASGGDGPLIGVDPDGGITDLTAAGFAASSRWSKWAVNVDGSNYNQWRSYKIIDAPDYIALRTRTTSTATYDGGCFAGRLLMTAAGTYTGFALTAGTWSTWRTGSANNGAIELHEAAWSSSAAFGASASTLYGLAAPVASDGNGNFNYARLPCGFTGGDGFPQVVGFYPHAFYGATDAVGKRWSVDGSTVLVNLNGTSWIWLDDGAYAE